MRYLTYAVLAILSTRLAFAQTAEIPFQKEKVMIGGSFKLIAEDDVSVTLQAQGEVWVSLPVDIEENGFYKITIVKEGAGSWDVLVDGEKYVQLTGLPLAGNADNAILPPVYLDKGRHSLIFYTDDQSGLAHKWRSLKIDRLSSNPVNCINTRQYWVGVNSFSRILKIGDMFSGSYVNVNIARDMAVFSSSGYQFISYYHPRGYLVVGRRKLDSAYFEKYWVPISINKAPIFPVSSADFSLSDPHNFIAMQMDGAGYIHLAFGHHSGKTKYLRSRYPYQINKWDTPESYVENREDEQKITYVRFIKLKSGNLLAAFRVGSSGNGYIRVLAYDIQARKWSKLYSPFITDHGYSNPYLWRPAVSGQGVIHLAWTWRLSKFNDQEANQMRSKYFSGFSNKDISYAQSHDEGKTWMRSDNSLYQLPIDRRGDGQARAEVIENIPPGESFFNHYGSDYDREGRPHFTYTRWGDAKNRVPQQWHLYWNGLAWKAIPATNYSKRYNWTRAQQNGLASTDLARPSIVLAKDNTAMIISRSKEFNNMIELYVSQGPDYEAWERVVAYPGSTGGWEPQMDLDLWHETNKLDLILLGITDKVIKKTHSAGPLAEMRNFLSMLKSSFENKEKNIHNYYSRDLAVQVMRIDDQLGEDTGYMLEIDYEALKKRLFSSSPN